MHEECENQNEALLLDIKKLHLKCIKGKIHRKIVCFIKVMRAKGKFEAGKHHQLLSPRK